MENSTVIKDPVCGMTVTNRSFHHLEHAGQQHYFCGVKCKARFAADLLRYAGAAAPVATPQAEGVPLRQALRDRRAWLLVAAVLVLLALALAVWLR
jgi:YHS domain-containing protein